MLIVEELRYVGGNLIEQMATQVHPKPEVCGDAGC